jgi:aspartate carbamoyltransferase catalytic subunit
VYTIKREIGTLDGIKLGLVGDLANGRTVRSLAYLIAKYQNNIKIYFVSPDVVKMKVLTLVNINFSLFILFSL